MRYLIRLDDACPTMDYVKWDRIEGMLDVYGIFPLVGIVPMNKDPKLVINENDDSFWEKVRNWEAKGWAIALHGFNHLFKSEVAGINPFWNRSEYAGVPLEEQKEMIKEGLEVLKNNNLTPDYFFAPGHTFDDNTLIALRECSAIRMISDTIAFHPYIKDGFIFIPQIVGHCLNMPINGTYTFCYHPNIMKERDFENLERFLRKNKDNFISFQSIRNEHLNRKTIFDRLLSFIFFFSRDLRRLREKDDLRRRKEKQQKE